MAASISEALDFAPTVAMLAAAVAELAELGARSGGAVGATLRQRALERYLKTAGARSLTPPQWRHDYAALGFDGLQWSSGRMRVPMLPPYSRQNADPDAADAPALAIENAGGLVHAGSTYLEPIERSGDPRIVLRSLADARREQPDRVAAIHGKIVNAGTDRFTALATAFQNCGAYVEIPDGVTLDAPLQLLWTAQPGEPGAVFPHTVVRVGAGARATIVERHIGSNESFTCGTVEIDLGAGARLDYVVVQQIDDGARMIVRRRARCAANATIGWHLAELGGALVRSVTGAQLTAAGASAETNAFFFARGFTHVDLVVDADHDASRTDSRTIVRGAAIDRGRGRFSGTLRVGAGARRSNASVRNDGLILSPRAYLDAAPVLAVPTDRVSASHATNIGSLDEEELFYVQTRGISRLTAQRMMALAFFEAAIARFPSDAVRDEVRTALDARLDEIPETFESN